MSNEISDFDLEQEANEKLFKDMIKGFRPDLYVLMDIIDQTNINPMILWKVAYHLNNIAIGNNYGQVNIFIEKGNVTFIRGEEANRINQPLIVKVRKPKGGLDKNV